MSTREQILDAYRDQIAEGGVASATLEVVAARAGVSKGGLLYHFRSKAALIEGLAERLQQLTQANLDLADTAGVVGTFLRTSNPSEDEARAYWAVFAAVRSGGDEVSEATRRTLIEAFEVWWQRLQRSIDDPVIADLVRLVGDGMYLSVVTGLPLPDAGRLAAVIDRVVALAAVE